MSIENKNFNKKLKELKEETEKPSPNPIALENIIDAIKRFTNSERRKNCLPLIGNKKDWELILGKYEGYSKAIEIIRKNKRKK